MTLDEQLRHAFENLASHLRDEVSRHAAMAIDGLATAAETERAEAVAEAARDAWSAAEQEGQTRLAFAVAETEARVRAGIETHTTASRILLLDAIRSMDRAASLTEILGALVAAAAAEMGRATLLLAEGDELRSWRALGFASLIGDAGDERGAITSSLASGGIVTDALEMGEVVSLPGASAPAPAFAALPTGRTATAVPLRMGGRAFAVLYADGGRGLAGSHDGGEAELVEDPVRSAWGAAAVEVLGRHAARCLESVTASRLAQAEAGA